MNLLSPGLSFALRVGVSAVVAAAIAARARSKRQLSASGATAAFAVGWVTAMAGVRFMAVLLFFFLTGSRLTKFRAEAKASRVAPSNIGEADEGRNATQVFCNGGIPAIFALLYVALPAGGWHSSELDYDLRPLSSMLQVGFLSAMSFATADTWASEVGVAFPSPTLLLPHFRWVPPGTNGGVSTIGTLAAVAGGTSLGLVWLVTTWILPDAVPLVDAPSQSNIPIMCMMIGLVGSLIDSLVGAWFQYSGVDRADGGRIVDRPSPSVKHLSGWDIFSNNQVNLVSAALSTVFGIVWSHSLF